MTVRELLALLAQQDPGADVVIGYEGVAKYSVREVNGPRRAVRRPGDAADDVPPSYIGLSAGGTARAALAEEYGVAEDEVRDVVVLVMDE